ncbi:MAG: flagellar basal body P-ring formation protein FlgA [Roseicyclus sp.]|nr:flagellar basal body P-ring formation protein FlgA [Roseicyclus sp.]
MRWLLVLLALASPAVAQETVIAAGTIRGATTITAADVAMIEGATPGALSDISDAIGMEARINLYPGRPIRPGDLRPPAIVERNEIVSIRYNYGGLLVMTEGRALDRAAEGETLRVINLASRQTVSATATAPGLVSVGPNR